MSLEHRQRSFEIYAGQLQNQWHKDCEVHMLPVPQSSILSMGPVPLQKWSTTIPPPFFTLSAPPPVSKCILVRETLKCITVVFTSFFSVEMNRTHSVRIQIWFQFFLKSTSFCASYFRSLSQNFVFTRLHPMDFHFLSFPLPGKQTNQTNKLTDKHKASINWGLGAKQFSNIY